MFPRRFNLKVPALSLFLESEEYTRHGWCTVPITEKEPPKGCTWTDKRGTVADVLYRQKYFCNNKDVKRQAILLDSIKFGVALDVDGAKALQIFQRKIVPRCSQELQDKINRTTHTKTANNGYHWLFEIQRKDFPKGVSQETYWTCMNNGHAEIKIIGTNQYLIERGHGYQPIRGIESLATLSHQEASELLGKLDRFDKETKTIRKVGSTLAQYWTQPKRHEIALWSAGYLYKNGVNKRLACELMEHIIDISGLPDDSLQKTLQRVEDTYSKNLETEQVAGYTKLLEAVDGDESVIITINQEFGKLGYHFNGNGHANKKQATPNDKVIGDKSVKLSAEVIELLRPNISLLFKDDSGTAFAALRVNGHLEIVEVHKSKRFNLWVRRVYYELARNTLGSEIISEVAETLESEALFEGPTNKLEPRINKDPNVPFVYWYDLGNEEWNAIRITPGGWSIVESKDVPIVFRRYAGQLSQVIPSRKYPNDIFEQFMKLLNIKDDPEIRLVYECYVIALLIPAIAKAIFIAQGPQGATKTTFQDLTKLVTDPSKVTNVTPPKTEEQLMQLLQHNAIVYFDNMSHMSEWLSNALCRAATGTAGLKRELYTNDDDIIYQYKRAIGFNGIALAANRADLLDRSFIVEIESVTDETRRTLEDDIMPELERIKPQLFGFILDTLVKMLHLKANGGIKLKTLSRMADFELHCEMISQCLGHEPLDFVNAYRSNKKLGTNEILENSSTANAMIEFMKDKNAWTGYASLLLEELVTIALTKLKIDTYKDKGWPRSANILSRRLKELKNSLLEAGIQVFWVDNPTENRKSINIVKVSPTSPTSPAAGDSRTNKTGCSGDTGDTGYTFPNSEENDGPYSCPQCNRRLKTLDLYREHIEGTHKENKLADMAAANDSGNGLLDKKEDKK